MQIENVTITQNSVLTGDFRILSLNSKRIAPQVRPGQFIHLRVSGRNEIVLRRPFSVFKAGRPGLTILYKIIGKGTEILSELRRGDRVSIIGPLGNGFPMPALDVYPLFVAGGYGSAALYLLAKGIKQKGILFIGGKTKKDILCLADFKRIGWKTVVATEDGSTGQKGLVTDVLIKWMGISEKVGRGWTEPSDQMLYACGPMGMLKVVSDIAIKSGLKAWLSLDRHMGCGVGACLACVQKVKTGNNGWQWARICTEGPVFECRQIVWE